MRIGFGRRKLRKLLRGKRKEKQLNIYHCRYWCGGVYSGAVISFFSNISFCVISNSLYVSWSGSFIQGRKEYYSRENIQ